MKLTLNNSLKEYTLEIKGDKGVISYYHCIAATWDDAFDYFWKVHFEKLRDKNKKDYKIYDQLINSGAVK